MDPLAPPTLSTAPVLLAVEWEEPRLGLRIDLVPLELPGDDSPSVLALEGIVSSLASDDAARLEATVGKACSALEWPETSGDLSLELYLDYGMDPLVIEGHYTVGRTGYSESDLRAKVSYLRGLAEGNLAEWWSENRQHADLRNRVRVFAEQGRDRASRTTEFLASSDSHRGDAARKLVKVYEELLNLLETSAGGS